MDLTPSGIGAWVLRTRWLVRLPVQLYRRGLGWLLGGRILMLEHRGRSSGLPRYVCLEVVERSGPDRLTVVSGFGERAQWYQNLLADPNCRVSTGRSRDVPGTAHFLSDEDSAAVLARYAERYPRAWRVLRSTVEKATGHPVQGLPMIELHLDPH